MAVLECMDARVKQPQILAHSQAVILRMRAQSAVGRGKPLHWHEQLSSHTPYRFQIFLRHFQKFYEAV